MVRPPQLGSLVRSLGGRDAGKYYLVVEILEPKVVLVADGLKRPLQCPKKKNPCHLQVVEGTAGLKEKLRRRQVSNEDLVRAIREMVDKSHSGEEREGIEPDVKKERRN